MKPVIKIALVTVLSLGTILAIAKPAKKHPKKEFKKEIHKKNFDKKKAFHKKHHKAKKFAKAGFV